MPNFSAAALARSGMMSQADQLDERTRREVGKVHARDAAAADDARANRAGRRFRSKAPAVPVARAAPANRVDLPNARRLIVFTPWFLGSLRT
jgi:hypothetical protein